MKVTNTKICANITDGGINLYVQSPEIANILSSGSFINYVWKNKEEVEKYGTSFDFSQMVKYFATPPKLRSSKDLGFVTSNHYASLFTYVGRKLGRKLDERSIFMDGSDRWLISTNKNAINLSALIDPRIKDGHNFMYGGVYIRKNINEDVLPVFRQYAEAFIKIFG